jgi:hypothetical protein
MSKRHYVMHACRSRSKYRAVRTEVDGIRFHSKREATRYQELRLLERAGELHGLVLQPAYRLVVGDWAIGHYVADFAYCTCDEPETCQRTAEVVEDAKGIDTPLSKWKRRHTEAQYQIEIQLV